VRSVGSDRLALLLALLAAGCGAQIRLEDRSQPTAPGASEAPLWTSQPQAGLGQGGRLAGVGVGATAAQAKRAALIDLAQQLLVRVRVQERVEERTFERRSGGAVAREDSRASLERRVETLSEALLPGARVQSVWTDPQTGRIWARVVAQRAALAEALASEAGQLLRAAGGWLEQAQDEQATALARFRARASADEALQRAAAALLAAQAAAPSNDVAALLGELRSLGRLAEQTSAPRLTAALVPGPFTPQAIVQRVREALAARGVAAAQRAPAELAVEVALETTPLGGDADGQMRLGWELRLAVRDAQGQVVVATRRLEGVAVGRDHADAMVAVEQAALRALGREIEELLDAALRAGPAPGRRRLQSSGRSPPGAMRTMRG